MSLHRYIVPPPLALAVHPAPAQAIKAKVNEKDKDKLKADVKAKAEAKEKGKPEAVDAPKAPAPAPAKAGAADTPLDSPAGSSTPDSPLSPASNVPEPPTPGLDAAKSPVGVPGPKEGKKKKRKASAAAAAAKAATPPVSDANGGVKSTTPASDKPQDDSFNKKGEKDGEDTPPSPIRLLCPAPPRPPRTRLDLDPARPYPPIHIDPRGAYHKYAKAVQAEVIFIDVTKDGWLVEQWREKGEREALDRLTGEAERSRQREVEARLKEKIIRPVPPSAEGLIKELWNDLVEAPSNEIAVDAFWARYDWSDPAAAPHAQVAREEMKKKWEEQRAEAAKLRDEKAEKAKKERDAAKAFEAEVKVKVKACDEGQAEKKDDHGEVKVIDKATETKSEEKKGADIPDVSTLTATARGYDQEVEWTKEGVETILATTGVQCAYNTSKPIPRHWSNPSGAYLLLSHGHFLLRLEQDIQFKQEDAANDFEVLVTSGHDRVFGEMVKAQQMEERKKKEREYRERKEREKREAKPSDDKAKAKPNPEGKPADDKAKAKNAGEKGDGTPGVTIPPASNVKHKDGEPIVVEGAVPLGTTDGKKDLAVVAVPVKEGERKKQTLDEKHEADPKVVGPTGPDAVAPALADEAAKPKDNKAKEKDAKAPVKRPRERAAFNERDLEMLVKLMGPEVANLPMSELKMAFAAMEAAQHASASSKDALAKKDAGPVIWTWNEPCEKWRWKNYAAGCAELEAGCWEERDWKVFPDDAGCKEYDETEEWMEKVEEGIYDWSC